MDKLYLLQLRDAAIEFLPRAQKTRDQAKKFAQTREQYHRDLFSDATISRGDPTATAAEIVAANVLHKVMIWIDCDPKSPKIQADLQLSEGEIESLVICSIGHLAQYLEKVTSRNFGIELPSNCMTPEKIDNDSSIKGVPKRKIMSAFQGLKWDYDHWGKNLASPPKWLIECRVLLGNKSESALWNPVCIGLYLLDEGVQLRKLDAVFVDLNDWADEWKEKTELERE